MRAAAAAALVLGALAAVASSGTARADSTISFEVKDRGDTVEVIAHNLTAATTKISPMRQRLEVPLTGSPIANRQMSTDPTVMQVELDGIDTRVLSIKLRLERNDVHAIATSSKATQVGSDLHVLFPRHVPAANTAVILPQPTVESPAASVPAAKLAPATVAAPVAPKPATLAPPPSPVVPSPASILPKTSPSPSAKSPTHPFPASASEQIDWPNTIMLGATALCALFAGTLYLRRRQQPTGPVSTIEVLAQRALGGKAKVMWLAAGDREMLVSVTAQSVSMLGQWPRGSSSSIGAVAPAGIPQAHARPQRAATAPRPAEPEHEDDRDAVEEWDSPIVSHTSPAVSGLLALRARMGTQTGITKHQQLRNALPSFPAATPDAPDADDKEADAVWAKEMLAAVRGYK